MWTPARALAPFFSRLHNDARRLLRVVSYRHDTGAGPLKCRRMKQEHNKSFMRGRPSILHLPAQCLYKLIQSFETSAPSTCRISKMPGLYSSCTNGWGKPDSSPGEANRRCYVCCSYPRLFFVCVCVCMCDVFSREIMFPQCFPLKLAMFLPRIIRAFQPSWASRENLDIFPVFNRILPLCPKVYDKSTCHTQPETSSSVSHSWAVENTRVLPEPRVRAGNHEEDASFHAVVQLHLLLLDAILPRMLRALQSSFYCLTSRDRHAGWWYVQAGRSL